MIIGSSPGQEEDEAGRPYVGGAGDMLRTVLGELGVSPNDVYLTTTVCCRTPDGRDPLPEELNTCKERLDALINILDPEVVLVLGKIPGVHLLGVNTSLNKTRGLFFRLTVPGEEGDYEVPAILTFEPAGLLRRGDASEAGMETLWRKDIELAFSGGG